MNVQKIEAGHILALVKNNRGQETVLWWSQGRLVYAIRTMGGDDAYVLPVSRCQPEQALGLIKRQWDPDHIVWIAD